MGRRIGKYEVQSELGRGGFGTVYKAYDPSVARLVALKVLSDLDNPETAERFRNEVQTAGSLRHANIVTIYDYGEHESKLYFVMEYLEGQDLQRVIASRQPLSLLEKVSIMAQVGRALQHAHERGIVHRDVKPSNIRLLADGSVKVMDFGIARLVRGNATRQTQRGLLIGTLRYISPEQLQGHDADAVCDIFAYGLVFYELIAGEYPFEAPDPAGVMAKIAMTDPAPLSQAAPDCPAALSHVVMRALARERQHRYQSLADLLLDLEPLLLNLQSERAAELGIEARALLQSDRIVEAETVVRKMLELEPQNTEARLLREQVQGRLREMSSGSRVEALMKAAEAQIEREAFTQASASLESALQMSPDNTRAAALLEEVRRRSQEKSLARRPSMQSGPAPERTDLVDPKDIQLPPAPWLSDERVAADSTGYFGQAESAEPLRASITILACPDSFREGQTVPVQAPTFTIGRIEGDLVIADDRTLSRRHASISANASGFTIRDLGSHNGTYLNGRRLAPNVDEPLMLNAEIRLSARTRLRFRCDISELPDFTGQELANRYTLTKCLRSGRKSALYEGADSRPVRKVAIKLLSPTLATYPGYLQQFSREAQTAADLNHAHICKIYEYGCAPLRFTADEEKPVNYLCMQMLDGGNLATRLDEPEHSTPTAVADWLDVVCGALDEAHRNGVVHAGIKPTSIVFSQAGTPYVTDFAIAIRPQDAGQSHPILGAPEYLAPEQWERLAAGPESDQYSVACLCYRVLTGSVPFENQMDPEARRRNFEQGALAAGVQAARQGRAALPEATSAALAKALNVNPAERFPSIASFARAFRSSLADAAPLKTRPRVFVSYRREADAGWAALFAEKLSSQHGLDVFVDRHRVDSARQVPEKIESAIRDSDFFVCLLSRSTLKSAWVREEIRIADAAGKRMIPVIHEGFRRPARWPLPEFLRWLIPRAWQFPECAKRLMDAEEVRLFADYDHSAVERLAQMILSSSRKA